MSQARPLPYGLRPTLRQQMIAVVYFALLLTLLDLLRKRGVADLFGTMLACGLLLSPWILGLLIMGLDRPGPLRNWMVSALFMLFFPALAIYNDWVIAVNLWRTGSFNNPLLTLLINGFFLGSFAVYWRNMGPATCPKCGRRALIPLMELWGQTRRTERTRWCAGCGDLYWRRPGGPWQIERRRTWLDGPPLDPLAAIDDGPAPAPEFAAASDRSPAVPAAPEHATAEAVDLGR